MIVAGDMDPVGKFGKVVIELEKFDLMMLHVIYIKMQGMNFIMK